MKIKDLPKIERPREKLERYGPERLSKSELLDRIAQYNENDARATHRVKKWLDGLRP